MLITKRGERLSESRVKAQSYIRLVVLYSDLVKNSRSDLILGGFLFYSANLGKCQPIFGVYQSILEIC